MTFSFYESDETEKKVVNTKEELVTEAVTYNPEIGSVADKFLRMVINEADRLSRGSKSSDKFDFVKAIVATMNSKIKSELLKDIKAKNDQADEASSQNQKKSA